MTRFILLFAVVASIAHAQLLQEITTASGKDVRESRIPALFVEKGEPPSAFLAAAAFESVWTGKINLPARYRITFSFEGEGTASLTIAGKEILNETGKLGTALSASTRLNRGEHDIQIRYRSRDDGSAHFRLHWEERSFPKQSVPPTVFTTEKTEQLAASTLARHGREIFATMHCAKCHISRNGHGSNPMQEIQEIAPIIVNSGDKVNAEWLHQWLTSPHSLRPGTPMPSLFDKSKDQHQQQIADVVAYLMAQKSSTPAAEPSFTPDDVKKGGEHFHNLACAACHTMPDAKSPDASGRRIPLHHVAEKFRPSALAAYLKDPFALAPHRGMPNLRLTDEETRTLSAFLLATAPAPAATSKPRIGDPARGATVAMEHHCYACHAGMPAPAKFTNPALEDIFLADWSTKGCVAATPNNPKVPDLQLNQTSRNALLAFRKLTDQAAKSLQHNDQAEAAERKFHSLRCDACHARDSISATLDPSETKRYLLNAQANDEKVDQTLPHMTYIGEMLQSSYIRQVISGNVTSRARPWLSMRMPSYSLHADSIANGFARIHGIDPQEKIPLTEITSAAAIGAALIDKETGFGCNTCHGVGEKGPTAAFEVMGINFDQSSTRLRREWYDRWMDHPAAITPTTKMPQYAPSGVSQNAALEGDGKKQFDAIWQYLHSLKQDKK